MARNGTNWLRAVSAFDRNAYLLFISARLLGFTYWRITYLLTNLFLVRLWFGTVMVGNLSFLFYLLVTVFSVSAGALGMALCRGRAMFTGRALALIGWAVAPAVIFIPGRLACISILVCSGAISAIGGALTASNSLNEAATQQFILESVATRYRALMSGAANMASTLGLAASALWRGYLIRAAGFGAVFLLSAGLLFMSAGSFAGLLGFRGRTQIARHFVPAQ